jgi:hypothetical protein
MKTVVSSLLLLGVLAVSGGSPVRAADPPTLRKGRVLLLKNEHTKYTIEGDIERVGDSYCVRNKRGEICIPAQRVLTLVASLPDAYTYLRGRINLGDPDERLRLARWCLDNGLRQQGLAELQAAVELRPSHAETRRLLLYWQQASAKADLSAQSAATKNMPPPPPVDPPPIEVTTESLGIFATRVQPILMNTCARCHATGHGGNFQLTQVFENSLNNRRSLERNLAAVLAEINVSQPETSRLLIKAVSDHAHTGQAPIRDRQAAPYRTLENWVKLTVDANPQLRDKAVPTQSVATKEEAKSETPASPSEEPRNKDGEESQWGTEARPRAGTPPSTVSRSDKGKSVPPPPPSAGTGAPVDPYDPEPFNRKMHPEANKPEPGK